MPFGPHRGAPMRDVPVEHLAWLRSQSWLKDWPAVAAYVALHQKRIDSALPEPRTDDRGGFSSYDDYLRYGRR